MVKIGKRNVEKDARDLRPLIYKASVPAASIFGGTPDTIEPDDAAAQGTSGFAARVDHQHAIATAAAVTLAYNSTNQEGSGSDFARATHTHQITNSANPGAAASILATDSSGYLQLVRLGIGTSPNFSLDVRSITTPQALIGYDASNYGLWSVSSGGDLTIQSNPGDLILHPIGNDVRPDTNYDVNLGMMTYKWKEIHAAELWVNTLVAHETIATIGGRILVGATTEFTADLGSGTTHTDSVLNGGFETAGGGGADVFANWTESAGDGAISQVGSNPHSGTYNARLDTGATANTHIYQDFSVSAGDYMSLSFWSRSYTGNTSVGRWWLYDVTNTSDIRSLAVIDNATAGDNTWVFTQYGFQVPVGCSSIRLYLYCGTTNTDDNHFDDVILYDAVTITVKHNEMAAGDVAYAEAAPSGTPQFEFFKVLSAASGSPDAYTYEVERNYDSHSGSGTYNDWYKGDALFNTGTDDEGFMDIYSYNSITQSGSTTGPTIAGFVRNTEYYNDWTERWAIGNLDGLYGEGATTYGVGLGDYANGNYMKYTSHDGTFMISGSDGAMTFSDGGLAISVDTSLDATRALRFMYGATPATYLWSYVDGTVNFLSLFADDLAGMDTDFVLQATAPATKVAGIKLSAYSGITNGVELHLQHDSDGYSYGEIYNGAFYIGNTSTPANTASGYLIVLNGGYVGADGTATDNDWRVVDDIAAGGGIWAGSAAGEPATGQVVAGGDGSSYGLYAGTGKDVQWYRNASNVWRTPDSVYIDGDIYTAVWTDYSSTSTVTGWSSFTYKYIYYKVIGKFVFVNFEIDGTSNSATTTFTLPYAEGHALVAEFVYNGYSTSGWAMRPGTMNSTTVNLYSTCILNLGQHQETK